MGPATEQQGWLHRLGPGTVAATTFAISDVLGKAVLNGGMDVLTLSTFRGLFSVAVMALWLRVGVTPVPHTPRQRWIALGVGVLFAAIVFGLFKAIELMTVPLAILSYFIYPLMTGIVASLLGMEKLGWRGAAAAVVALLGLALTVGANPGGIALAGLGFAFGAAVCRAGVLLITRGMLHDADPRLTSWYSLVSSTLIFAACSLAIWHWQGPQDAAGWIALVVLSLSTTIAVLTLFVSVQRIGPFRSALLMNLEPLLATLFSAAFLGEIITPIQALGGAIMLAALVAFQLRR
jgi:drug/metabolite transporter (DMT)-like permease